MMWYNISSLWCDTTLANSVFCHKISPFINIWFLTLVQENQIWLLSLTQENQIWLLSLTQESQIWHFIFDTRKSDLFFVLGFWLTVWLKRDNVPVSFRFGFSIKWGCFAVSDHNPCMGLGKLEHLLIIAPNDGVHNVPIKSTISVSSNYLSQSESST